MSTARRPATGAPRARVTPSRRVAYSVLTAVSQSDAYANLLLPVRLAEAHIAGADAGFATELTYGTLRMRGFYDRVIELAAGRPAGEIDPPVLDLLRLGAHQLLGMRVAPHAAVDETVTLARLTGSARASGFVNGVLRSLTRATPEEWRERATAGLQGDALLAVERSHPEWVIAELRDALTAEGAANELPGLLDADNTPPRVALVALPGLADPAEVGEPGTLSPLGVLAPAGDPAGLPAVAAGRVRVQDEGSQVAALALTRARPVLAGERWLDLCAGPGGKTAVLAAEALLGGATLTASELVPARAGLVRRAVAVFGDDAPEVVTGDGRDAGRDGPRFDRILLDAPCTGLGALRRRPEARWRKQTDDLEALVRLQAELLDAAVAALRPGGLLAYVTCSPVLAETRRQVEAALERHPALEALDTPGVVRGLARRDPGLAPGTGAQLWPHRNGTDAMFIQLLRLGPATD